MNTVQLAGAAAGRAGVVSGGARPFQGSSAGVTRAQQGLSHPGRRELPPWRGLTPESLCGSALAGPAPLCPAQLTPARPGQAPLGSSPEE